MKTPVQAPPVSRVGAAAAQSVTQSGCCLRVLGRCVYEHPLCPG